MFLNISSYQSTLISIMLIKFLDLHWNNLKELIYNIFIKIIQADHWKNML